MNRDLVLIVGTIVAGFAVSLILIKKWLQSGRSPDQLAPWLQSLQSSVDLANKTVNEALRATASDVTRQLQDNNRALNERLDHAARTFADVQKHLAEVANIAGNFKSLQQQFLAPKIRGGFGEQLMEKVITDIIPAGFYAFQHKFSSGDVVDAVIKTNSGLLPIDAKFPIPDIDKIYSENPTEQQAAKKDYALKVKKHIDDISSKYILPHEQTLQFALMYIPSESIYYLTISDSDLNEYFTKKRVVPVSPNLLYAHLYNIFLSLQSAKLASKVSLILNALSGIEKEFFTLTDKLATLQTHITNMVKKFDEVNQSSAKLGRQISATSELGSTHLIPESRDDQPSITAPPPSLPPHPKN